MNNYAKQLGNPDKTDKFLETHKLTHEETEKVNRPIIGKEREWLVNKNQTPKKAQWPKKKSLKPQSQMTEFGQISEEITVLFKLF